MKRILVLLAFLLLVAVPIQAQIFGPDSCKVAGLRTGGCGQTRPGARVLVTDARDAGDCTLGGAADVDAVAHVCRYVPPGLWISDDAPISCTVAALQAGTCAPPVVGSRAQVVDALALDSCSVGQGVVRRICQYNGSGWVPEGVEPASGSVFEGAFRIWVGDGWAPVGFPACDAAQGLVMAYDSSLLQTTGQPLTCVTIENVASVSTTTTTTTTTTSTTTTTTTTTSTTTTTLAGNPPGLGPDCQSAFNDPWCVTDASNRTFTYTGTSGATGDQSVACTLGAGPAGDYVYLTGKFANGDYWIVGQTSGSQRIVEVASCTPTQDTPNKRNGQKADPALGVRNNLDGRQAGSFAPDTLPASFNAQTQPVSLVKANSVPAGVDVPGALHVCQDYWSAANRSCFNFAHVFTFVGAVPDYDSDGVTSDEMRPSFMGPTKAYGVAFNLTSGFLTRVDAMPAEVASGVASRTQWTLQQIATRYRWIQMNPVVGLGNEDFRPMINSEPEVIGTGPNSYGNVLNIAYSTSLLRMMLDDFDQTIPAGSTSRQALLNYLQAAIDEYGAILNGQTYEGVASTAQTNPGGITVGHKIPVLAAAVLFDHAAMQDLVENGIGGAKKFFEDNTVYATGGVPYWGITGGLCDTQTSNCSSVNRSTYCRAFSHATTPFDAGCCTNSDSYPSQLSNNISYQTLAVNLWGQETLWNLPNVTSYAAQWEDGGGNRSTAGHACNNAPTGSSNTGSFGNTGYQTGFGEEMWDDFGYAP